MRTPRLHSNKSSIPERESSLGDYIHILSYSILFYSILAMPSHQSCGRFFFLVSVFVFFVMFLSRETALRHVSEQEEKKNPHSLLVLLHTTDDTRRQSSRFEIPRRRRPPPPPLKLTPYTTKAMTTSTPSSPTNTTTTITTTSTGTDQQRSYGHVKTLSTTPRSLTIIPDSDDDRRPIVALGLSTPQLSTFLLAFAKGRMRVSYVLRKGGGAPGGVVTVEDVRSERRERVEGEGGRGGGGSEGLMMTMTMMMGEEDRVRRESTVGFVI